MSQKRIQFAFDERSYKCLDLEQEFNPKTHFKAILKNPETGEEREVIIPKLKDLLEDAR